MKAKKTDSGLSLFQEFNNPHGEIQKQLFETSYFFLFNTILFLYLIFYWTILGKSLIHEGKGFQKLDNNAPTID